MPPSRPARAPRCRGCGLDDGRHRLQAASEGSTRDGTIERVVLVWCWTPAGRTHGLRGCQVRGSCRARCRARAARARRGLDWPQARAFRVRAGRTRGRPRHRLRDARSCCRCCTRAAPAGFGLRDDIRGQELPGRPSSAVVLGSSGASAGSRSCSRRRSLYRRIRCGG